MKKITFNIRTNKGKLEQRQGYAVELPEYPDLKFGCCKERCPINSFSRWRVTELTSGAIFLSGDWNESRKDCIKRTIDRLHKYGLAECKCRISNFVNQFADSGEAN
ncbi:MAG: hypothetical protein WBC22_12340 [Sedimentisphaerales bacterium]